MRSLRLSSIVKVVLATQRVKASVKIIATHNLLKQQHLNLKQLERNNSREDSTNQCRNFGQPVALTSQAPPAARRTIRPRRRTLPSHPAAEVAAMWGEVPERPAATIDGLWRVILVSCVCCCMGAVRWKFEKEIKKEGARRDDDHPINVCSNR